MIERFERLTDDDLARMHLSLFGMELDAADLARLRLAEHALYTWDIAVSLDPTAQVAPDAVALLVDTLGALAGWVGKPQGKRFRLRVRTSDPARDLILQVGDAVELKDQDGNAVDGETPFRPTSGGSLWASTTSPESAACSSVWCREDC